MSTVTPVVAASATHQFKVVVAGPFAAGKTTFIQQISQTEVVGTEARTSGAEAQVKDATTVGMEYGTYAVEDEDLQVQLLLFGVPGQRRFQFMWDIVSEGMDALLVIVDACRPESWDEATRVAAHLLDLHPVPVVVAVNRSSQVMGALEAVVDRVAIPGAEYLACEVVERSSATEALILLLTLVLEQMDEAAAGVG